MDILLIESYFAGSHAQWAKGFAENSCNNVALLTLPGRYWKWRMHGGAVTLSGRFLERIKEEGPNFNLIPDLILVSDMLDLTTFLALTRQATANIPVAIYFHENQLSYPWQAGDRDVKKGRDAHYGFINFSSALAADKVFFNSRYHQESFLEALEKYLKGMPEYNEEAAVEQISRKSSILYPGMGLADLEGLVGSTDEPGRDAPPLILWNHRWEYDKNPEVFFKALYRMADKGLDFEVAVLGENFSRSPVVFEEARERLGARVKHYGFLKDRSEYARWLARADILPVTSVHDFFGFSVIEAIYMNTLPILPRRLAYPEHIPEPLREKYLYNNNDEFCARLEAAIRGVAQVGGGVDVDMDELKNHVVRYDWSNMAASYDEDFESVVKGITNLSLQAEELSSEAKPSRI